MIESGLKNPSHRRMGSRGSGSGDWGNLRHHHADIDDPNVKQMLVRLRAQGLCSLLFCYFFINKGWLSFQA